VLGEGLQSAESSKAGQSLGVMGTLAGEAARLPWVVLVFFFDMELPRACCSGPVPLACTDRYG
jgi:hypothetical protein